MTPPRPTDLPAQEILECLRLASLDSPLGLTWSIATEPSGHRLAHAANSAQPGAQQHLSDSSFTVEHGNGRALTIHADGRAVLVLGDAPARPPKQLHDEAVILHQLLTGRTVLHGSAVTINGRGVAVIGASGAGKSTTAAALARRGANVLSDDVVVIDQSTGLPRLLPVESTIRLMEGSGGEKREFRPLPTSTAQPVGLHAVVALSLDRTSGTAEWSRLTGLAALDSIVELGAGNRGLAIHGRARFLQQLSKIADHAQVWQLRRTPTSPTADGVAERIERLLRSAK